MSTNVCAVIILKYLFFTANLSNNVQILKLTNYSCGDFFLHYHRKASYESITKTFATLLIP